MRLAFLSPRIQREILAGTQPANLRLEDLMRAPMPICWKAQERMIARVALSPIVGVVGPGGLP
jgi:site-specific DNA recombinase